MDLRSIVNAPDTSPKKRLSSSSRRSTLASLLNDDDDHKIYVPGGQKSPSSEVLSSNESSRQSSVTAKPAPNAPRRYKQPPIWAQSWLNFRPAKERRSSRSYETQDGQQGGSASAGVSNSQTARSGSTPSSSSTNLGSSLMGLTPSISGILPADEVTLKICEWLYIHFSRLTPQERKYAEVEFKVGTILDNASRQRLDLPAASACVLATNFSTQKTSFESEIGNLEFQKIESLMDDLVSRAPEKPAPGSLTKLPEQRLIDEFWPSPRQGSGRLRLTYNESEQLVAQIIKARIADLCIYSPADKCDLRISLSVETPITQKPELNGQPVMVRRKNRQSWLSDGAQLDLTSVLSGRKGSSHSTKEAELELNSELLIGAFEEHQASPKSNAMEKFQEVIQYGVDSCRVILRHLSRQ